jgi:hypothetical protein
METENPNFSPRTGLGSWRVGISVLLVLKRNTVPVPNTHNAAPVARLVPLLEMEIELPNSEQSADLFGILTNKVPVELNRKTAPPKTVKPGGPTELAWGAPMNTSN